MVDASAEIENAEGLVADLAPGGRLIRVEPLRGGVSAEVLRIDLVRADGEVERVVMRRQREVAFKESHGQTAALEYGVLAALHRAGLAVPEPLLVHGGNERAASSLIMEWVEGTTDVEAGELNDALDQMAFFLAELHGLDASSLAVPGLAPIEDPISSVRAYLPEGRVGEDVGRALDALAPRLEPNALALVHGDYWPGNVIWREGALVAVIDWEDACLGDPLADLAAARVELVCAYGTDAMERFTSRYLTAIAAEAIAPFELGPLPVWEVYASASALSTMHEWGLDPVAEADRRRRTQRFFERAAQDLAGAAVGRVPRSD